IVSCPAQHERFTRWTTDYGFDFSRARDRATNHWRQESIPPEDVLVEPRCWALLDYRSIQHGNVSGGTSWTTDRRSVAHGICVWFDTETAPGIGFSNSPTAIAVNRHVYKQGFFPWPEATELRAGDEVRVRIRADFVQDDYVWTWETSVTDGRSHDVRAAYR